MGLGLYVEGINLMFDDQKVGELSVPEGTTVYEEVVDAMMEKTLTDDEIEQLKSTANNDGYNNGYDDGCCKE